MTLADLIRKYLEDRRRVCEQKTRYLDLSSDNFQFYSDHNQDENVISLSNDQFFSNNIDPKSSDHSRGSDRKIYKQSFGVSRTSRIKTLPDGSVQIETITRDDKGNEEKTVTYHKDGKKYTTITRRDPSGKEEVEERVGDSLQKDRFNSHPFARLPKQDAENKNDDYFYNKFFKSADGEKNGDWSNVTPVDPNLNMDEQLEKILKGFAFGGFFGPVPGFPGSSSTEDGTSSDSGVFPDFNDSSVNEEMRKMFENFGKMDFNSDNDLTVKKNNKNLERHMNKIFKSITPPKPPSMFDQFAEEAYIELPEESTPLDKFVEPDEDRLDKLKPIWRKSRDVLEKLEKYFASKPNDSLKGDVYSDIEDPNDIDLSSLMPQPQPELPPIIRNYGDVLRKTFDPEKLIRSGNIQSQMYFGDGKKRTESIRKDADGNTEKNILYQVGDQKYNVKIITNRFGVEVKREKSQNFPKNELTKFKKQWGREFTTDFMDD